MEIQIVDKLPNDFILEEAMFSDITDIYLIELASQPSPWGIGIFEKEFALDFSHLWVARFRDRQVVAYLAFWLIADEVHILNVVVHPHFRRLGLAKGLIDSLFHSLKGFPLVSMTLEVRESNTAARNLYSQFGFLEVGRRDGYYTNNHESAIVMTRIMNE